MSTLRKTVLIIEDNLDVRDALAVALTVEGYDAICAESRDEALQALEASRPALILMDHQMPGLGADEFIKQVRARYERIPVVLMTAGHSAPSKAMQLGLKHALQKPFDYRTLLRTVNQLTRRATQIIRSQSQRELAVN
jgi:DNA-binding response OmpR family regulator